MAIMTREIIATLVVMIISMILLPSLAEHNVNTFHLGYYSLKCPQVEFIVHVLLRKTHAKDPRVSAGLIRLFMHDCFVKGCDASLLLDQTPSGEPVEKTSPSNGVNLRGFDVIDEIKKEIEQVCPDTVSCADILAFATREAISLSGLPWYPVRSGRRDSRTSRASDIPTNLPSPKITMDEAIQLFAKKGFSIQEMVVLMGSHSVGTSKCKFFNDRIYNFTQAKKQDPSLDPNFAAYLKTMCHDSKTDDEIEVPFDLDSPLKLDTVYYKNMLNGKALLQFDQIMAHDPRTSEIVHEYSLTPSKWPLHFIKAMNKMGKIDVLTGNQGQIRKNCRVPN